MHKSRLSCSQKKRKSCLSIWFAEAAACSPKRAWPKPSGQAVQKARPCAICTKRWNSLKICVKRISIYRLSQSGVLLALIAGRFTATFGNSTPTITIVHSFKTARGQSSFTPARCCPERPMTGLLPMKPIMSYPVLRCLNYSHSSLRKTKPDSLTFTREN